MELTQGVKFRVLPSVKFKDIGIYIRFIHPLTPQFATKCSLMALMMTDRCEAYPTKQAMSRRSDELYGLSLGTQTVGYGAAQVMEMRARMIHPRFAHSASFLEEGIRFLRELIFAPLFSEENLEEAKRVLRMKIERMRDDAAQYVIHRGLKEAGKGHPLAVSSLGEIEELEGLTLEDMRQTHQALLERSGIEILVCGDLQEAQVGPLFRQYFSFVPREAATDTHYVVTGEGQPETLLEERDIPQTSIMVLYYTHTDVLDPDYYALRVMNAMLGQYSTSLLFQNVREKNSLCYSIYSNLISFDGALGIMTGVDPQHVDKALALIEEQVEKLRQGDFDDELLTVSQTMIRSSLKAGDDVMNSIVALQYQNDLLGRDYTSDTIISLVDQVSREDVIAMACRLEHRLTCIVGRKEDADEDDQK